MTSSSDRAARDARQAAQDKLGASASARVLEPSPPTITVAPYLADDPVAVGDLSSEQTNKPVVVPAGMATDAGTSEVIDWNQWLADNPGNGDWIAEHWLGGARRLPPAPASLVASRTALHRLGAYVIAPVRHQANGKFGLRWTKGGFGTPFFGADRQVRVEGTDLIDQHGDATRRTPVTSLQAAADFLGTSIDPDTAAEHDSPPVGDPKANLAVDAEAVAFLDGWYGMAFAALELLRVDDVSVNPSRPQIWPGHFDPAIEVGTEDARGSYGASPGDHGSDEPYLYVSVWWPDRLDVDVDDDFWNAEGFVGRLLKLSDFPTGSDPVDVAAGFWRETRDRIAGVISA